MDFDISFGKDLIIFEPLCHCGQVAYLSKAVIAYVRPGPGIPWRPGYFGHRSCLALVFRTREIDPAEVVWVPALDVFSELVWDATTLGHLG